MRSSRARRRPSKSAGSPACASSCETNPSVRSSSSARRTSSFSRSGCRRCRRRSGRAPRRPGCARDGSPAPRRPPRRPRGWRCGTGRAPRLGASGERQLAVQTRCSLREHLIHLPPERQRGLVPRAFRRARMRRRWMREARRGGTTDSFPDDWRRALEVASECRAALSLLRLDHEPELRRRPAGAGAVPAGGGARRVHLPLRAVPLSRASGELGRSGGSSSSSPWTSGTTRTTAPVTA